ncbi:MAG: hypothetical protein ABWZ25_18775 [Chitinophagaceae bacterium]
MYRNASDAFTDMRERGFDGFEFSGDDLLRTTEKMFLKPEEFMIIESHRFCMPAGRGADIVVHGIVMHASSVKGILISHCSGKRSFA